MPLHSSHANSESVIARRQTILAHYACKCTAIADCHSIAHAHIERQHPHGYYCTENSRPQANVALNISLDKIYVDKNKKALY